MRLSQVGRALRERWWLVLAPIFIAVAVSLGSNLLQSPTYTATTQLFVATTNAANPTDVYTGSQFSQGRVSSYIEILQGPAIAERVAKKLGLRESSATLQDNIAASAVADTVLINVSVSDAQPREAARLAQAVAADFISYVDALEARNDSTGSPVHVSQTYAPAVPSSPSAPSPTRDAALAAVLGLLLGVALAIAVAAADTTVKSELDLTSTTGVPLIGSVLATQGRNDRSGRAAVESEDFERIRTNLKFFAMDAQNKTLAVTSAVEGEGKTTVAMNLALSLVRDGSRTCLIDADLRQPAIASALGLSNDIGLSDVLAGTVTAQQAMQESGGAGLVVLPSGPVPPNPAELLGSQRMRDLLAELSTGFDFIVLDTAPALPVADAAILAAEIDGVLLVAGYGTTTRQRVSKAVEALRLGGAAHMATVLNRVPPRSDIARNYGYGRPYGRKASQPASAARSADAQR